MTIYTKKGDKGETGLPGKRRLSKTDQLFEFLGSLDQTNAQIGLAVSLMDRRQKQLAERFQNIQRSFLAIGACVASEKPEEALILTKLDDLTAKLEADIDGWDQAMPELKNFILPGGTAAAAALQVARTLVRQAERNFHRLEVPDALSPVSRYINRLSDYCFQAARYCNFLAKTDDKIWTIETSV